MTRTEESLLIFIILPSELSGIILYYHSVELVGITTFYTKILFLKSVHYVEQVGIYLSCNSSLDYIRKETGPTETTLECKQVL